MYYKKQGNTPPIIRTGCTYDESYFYDGYLYFKYSENNTPSEELTEITQEEYEANKPVIEKPDPPTPEPTEQEILQAEMLLNQTKLLENQKSQDAVMAELLLNQMGV